MNINTLQYFISAAEHSNFTKAAKEHFVAQTAVSQQISKLEQEIGVPLFIREKKRVVLTNEGQIFYREVKKVLDDYSSAIRKTRQCYQEQKKVLTIGYARQMDIDLLSETLVEYQKEYPEVEIIIKQDSIHNLMQEVKHGVCDVFLNMKVTLSQSEEERFMRYTYHSGEMWLAVSAMHPKAQKSIVNAIELKEEEFIVLNTGGEEYGFPEMHAHCKEDGYDLKVKEYATNLGALFFQVELNHGVAFVHDRMENPCPERIKFLAISNSHHKYGVDLIWEKELINSTGKEFVTYVKERLPK